MYTTPLGIKPKLMVNNFFFNITSVWNIQIFYCIKTNHRLYLRIFLSFYSSLFHFAGFYLVRILAIPASHQIADRKFCLDERLFYSYFTLENSNYVKNYEVRFIYNITWMDVWLIFYKIKLLYIGTGIAMSTYYLSSCP